MEVKNIDFWRKKADENLRDAIRYRINNIEGANLYQGNGYILYTIGIDTTDPHLNGGLCLDDEYAGEMVEKAEKFFGELGFNYSFWLRAHGNPKLEKILKDKGYEAGREPGSAGMIIFDKIKSAELPKGYSLKEVNSKKEVDDFMQVIKEAFEKEEDVVGKMFSSADVLMGPNVKSFLIYEGDKAVSAGITVLSPQVAGIYYVATLESQRGKGIGSYIVKISSNEGFKKDKQAVILQASELGESVYKKLGYQTITHYRTYKIEK